MSYTQEDIHHTLQQIDTFLVRCNKAQIKFNIGTSQYTLLKNRIKALTIVKSIITNDQTERWTKQELMDAMPPIVSIIHKCQKAQEKHDVSSIYYKRMETIIFAMQISVSFLKQAIDQSSSI